jgi:hypothetical protein
MAVAEEGSRPSSFVRRRLVIAIVWAAVLFGGCNPIPPPAHQEMLPLCDGATGVSVAWRDASDAAGAINSGQDPTASIDAARAELDAAASLIDGTATEGDADYETIKTELARASSDLLTILDALDGGSAGPDVVSKLESVRSGLSAIPYLPEECLNFAD